MMTIEEALEILKEKTQASNTRLEALLLIVEQFDPKYFPLFEEILKDPDEDPDVRSSIALALGKLSGDHPFEILKSYTQDADKMVRNYVVQALGMTHLEAALPLVLEALKDKDNTVFASASEAIAQFGDMATPYLIELLSSGGEDARCVAAWQLGELKASEAVHPLVETIRSDKSVSVLALCIWALGEIGFGSDEVFEILSEAKKEPEPDVRLRAEIAMKKIARHRN